MLDGGEEKKMWRSDVRNSCVRRKLLASDLRGRQDLEKFQEIEACYISKLDR